MEQPDERIALTQNALVAFLNATVDLHEKRPVQACNGSRMAHDVSAFGKESPFDNAVTVSDLAFQYTHDHLSLFADALTRLCDPITSCTLIRSSLETAAVGAWVVDPTISTLERVARVYSIRYESIVQNVKVLRCSKGIKQSDLDQTIARIDVIATDADACGVPVGRHKGKVTWVGAKKPGATDMISHVLNDEWMYRLLSAVAHGHHWALRDIGFVKLGDSDNTVSKGTLYKKRSFPEAILLVALHGMLAYSRLIWNTIGYRETDRLAFEEILETTMDRMYVATDLRFWRRE